MFAIHGNFGALEALLYSILLLHINQKLANYTFLAHHNS